ncbi:MAG: hypothetical protein WC836_22565, partial [Desulfobacula sp.]
LNRFSKNSIVSNVGIEFLEKGPDFISASMPVDNRTIQPLGILMAVHPWSWLKPSAARLPI